MDDLLQDLIAYAIEKKASDIHFVVQNQKTSNQTSNAK